MVDAAKNEDLIRPSTHASVTHNLPFTLPAVPSPSAHPSHPAIGDIPTSTSPSSQRRTGGISSNDVGVDEVSVVCWSGEMEVGGVVRGCSMVDGVWV